MAVRQLGNTVEVRLGASLASSFNKAFSDAERTVKRLGTSVDRLARAAGTRPFEQIEHDVKQASHAFRRAEDDLRKIERRLASGEQQTDELTNAWFEASQRVDKSRRDLDELSRELDTSRRTTKQASSATDEYGRSHRTVAQNIDRSTRAQEQYNRTIARGDELQSKAGKFAMGAAGTAAVGYGMSRLLAAPLRTGMEFSQAATRVKSLANETGDAFTNLDQAHAALEDTMMKLGKDTAFKAGEVADAAKYLTIAGFNITEVTEALPATLDLSIVGETDLGRTADIMSNIMQSFALDADQSSRVADVLTKTVTTANTNLNQLGDAMSYVAPVAKQMGLTMEQTAAYTAMLSNAGIQASKAGTALRAMFTRLARPRGEGDEVLKELGVAVQDAQGNFRDPGEIMSELNEGMIQQGLGTRERLNRLAHVFGQEAMAGAAVLLDSAVAQGKDASAALNDYITSLTEVTTSEAGIASRTAEKQLDNLGGDWEKFTGAVDHMFNELFAGTAPTLRTVVTWMERVTSHFAEWLDDHPVIARVIGVTATAMTGLTFATAGLLAAMSARYWIMGAWTKAMGRVTLANNLASASTGRLGVTTAATSKAMGVHGTVAGATSMKVGLVAGAHALMNNALAGTKARLQGVATWYTVTNARLASNLLAVKAGTAAWIKHNLTLTAVTGKLQALSASSAAAKGGLIGIAAGSMGHRLKTTMKMVGGALLLPVSSIKALGVAATAFLSSNPLGWVIAGVAAAAFAIYKYWEPISSFARGVWRGVADALQPVSEATAPAADAFQKLGNAVKSLTDTIIDFLSPVDESWKSLDETEKSGYRVGQMAKVIEPTLTSIANAMTSIVTAIDWVIVKLDELFEKFEWLHTVTDGIKAIGDALNPFNLGKGNDPFAAFREGREERAKEKPDTTRRNTFEQSVVRPHLREQDQKPTFVENLFRVPDVNVQQIHDEKGEKEADQARARLNAAHTLKGVETGIASLSSRDAIRAQYGQPLEEKENPYAGKPYQKFLDTHEKLSLKRKAQMGEGAYRGPLRPDAGAAPQEEVKEGEIRYVVPTIKATPKRPSDAAATERGVAITVPPAQNSVTYKTNQIDNITIEVSGAQSPAMTADEILTRWNEEMLMTERELVD